MSVQCRVSTCPRPLDPLGDGSLCNLHRKILTRNGSLEFAPIKGPDRKPFIEAAAKALKGSPVLSEINQLLESCRPWLCPQADVLRRGWLPKEKAKAILARIHQQRGGDAALGVLAAFLGTASMPMQTSDPRYLKAQVARAVFRLLRSDNITLYGVTRRSRIGAQGWRIPAALYDLIDAIAWPLRSSATGLRKKGVD